MALKSKIDEEAFKKLDKSLQAEYKKQDDGSYALDLEGAEDTGALKRAKDHEKEERKKAEQKTKELEAQIAEIQEQLEAARTEGKGKGDKVTETERAWQAKLAKREKELQAQIDSTQVALKAQMVDAVAANMAAELAGDNAELLLPHIQRRLSAEIVEGKAVTRVLGADGTTSALTPEELKKEVLSSPKFSAIVIASKGSGGGAGGVRKGASGSKKLSDMTATEEAIFANQDPKGYEAALAAEKPAR